MHKFLFYNKFIIFLYMFRALLCSSSGGQNCIIQHLVSSHSVGGRPVHRLREGWLHVCMVFLCLQKNYEMVAKFQWRTQEFCSGGGGGSTNSVEDRQNRDLGAVAP